MKEKLHQIALELLSRDADNSSELDNYDAEDVMNASIIVNSITSNYGIKHGVIDSKEKSAEMGQLLHEVILKRTGVNTKTYYDSPTPN